MDVLVVEDDPLVRETVAWGLEDVGLEVAAVPTAEPAIEAATTTGPPQVLVTDIDLGAGLDGVALAAIFAVRWPEVAVIFITGRDDKHPNGYALGPYQRLLPKPFSLVALAGIVLGFIEQSQRGADPLVTSAVGSPSRQPDHDPVVRLTSSLSSPAALAGRGGQAASNAPCDL